MLPLLIFAIPEARVVEEYIKYVVPSARSWNLKSARSLPIAFVYNLAHYFTLILVRTPVLPYLLTDPFGIEWNPLNLPHRGDPP